MDERADRAGDSADELLRRALIDPEQSIAVALKVEGLALTEALTVVFHGRADLSTIQTYVANGGPAAGSASRADELLRVPSHLHLGDAGHPDEAGRPHADQDGTLRHAVT